MKKDKIRRFHRRFEKFKEEKESETLKKYSVEYDAIISFRITAEMKQMFFDACNTSQTTPRKYVTGNILRRFVYAYIQSPAYMEKIIDEFEAKILHE